MKSYFLVEPGRMEMRETPVPEPEEGELIIRIEAALTCGTDLKAFRRGHPKMPMPTPFGHEFSGIIADAGKSVNGWHEGDAIMGVHTAPCGDCTYCRRQLENLCPVTMDTMLLGAYAEYIKIPRHVVELNTFRKPASLSYEQAATLEPLACVVHGIEQLTMHPDDTVLILGAGSIGLLHILMARIKGAHKIIVAGKHPQRLELAGELGADHLIDVSRQDTREGVLELTRGYGANRVFECTGQPVVWEQAVNLAARGGSVILFGGCAPGTSVSFDTNRLHYDQIALIGTFHFTPRDVATAYHLLVEEKLDVSKLITGTFPLTKLNQAFDLLMQGEGIKYAIEPGS
ncbi:MAG: zinc-binding dehydrogenase [bacterium]